jgi:2'-5' RNA ligase
MQKKKIFIEIAVPDQLKRRLAQKTTEWSDLPIKWVKENNLHITVAFVGYVDESVIPDICRKINEAVNDLESFEITFNKIGLGPNIEDPKMIWLSGEPNSELGKLNETIEEALGMHPQKHKHFCPHVTLGRIRKLKWDKLPEKPVIDEKVNLAMAVESVSVMESKGGDSGYDTLEECMLV